MVHTAQDLCPHSPLCPDTLKIPLEPQVLWETLSEVLGWQACPRVPSGSLCLQWTCRLGWAVCAGVPGGRGGVWCAASPAEGRPRGRRHRCLLKAVILQGAQCTCSEGPDDQHPQEELAGTLASLRKPAASSDEITSQPDQDARKHTTMTLAKFQDSLQTEH